MPLIGSGMRIASSDLEEDKQCLMASSWLQARTDENGFFGLGCVACAANLSDATNTSRTFRRFEVAHISMMKMFPFERHARLPAHRANVCKYLGIALGPSDVPLIRCPTQHDFELVAKHIRAGGSPKEGIQKIGTRHKLTKMVFCLAEGFRELDRRALAVASRTSLRRDEAKGVLYLRYATTNQNFDVTVGVLGTLDNVKSGAVNTVRATRQAVEELATRDLGAPSSSVKPQLDEKLATQIRDSITQCIVDSASYELLACRLMREGVQGEREALTRNLKMVTPDMMHRSGRSLTRTFNVDTYLNNVLNDFVSGTHSIIQLIDHSVTLRDYFGSQVKSTPGAVSNDIRSLHSAKHRAAFFQKTLGRHTLFIDALIATAEYAVHDRAGRAPSKHAQAYLDKLCEESYLQAAMMADAADESMYFKEYVDRESVDVCKVADELAGFKKRLVTLFRCGVCTDMGYTAFALAELRVPKCIRKSTGMAEFGSTTGVSARTLERCKDRMRAWVKVTLQLIEAEFPDFDVTLAFRAFRLGKELHGRDRTPDEEHRADKHLDVCLQRILDS